MIDIGFFQILVIVNSASMNVKKYVFSGQSFGDPWGRCPKVELLGQVKAQSIVFEKHPYCSPKGLD